jgi:predicted nucleic acid-binding protein
MILYLDTSALVKRYVMESGSKEVNALIESADTVGSAVLTQVEMASTLAKAVCMNWVEADMAQSAWQDFISHWHSIARLSVTPALVEYASRLAWEHGFRSDATHFAAALRW